MWIEGKLLKGKVYYISVFGKLYFIYPRYTHVEENFWKVIFYLSEIYTCGGKFLKIKII